MLSILVANTKGGCGKTTIATHLAAAFATGGRMAMLADVDRQRCSLGWIGRRPGSAAPLSGIDWSRSLDRPPRGIDRLVIDAPAGLRTRQLEELVERADLIVLPVLPGSFDELSTRRFLSKLAELKPIMRGRKPVAVVGNRLRPNTRAAERLESFLDGVGQRVVARIRDAQLYADVAAAGLTLFDLADKRGQGLRADWDPLLGQIEALG